MHKHILFIYPPDSKQYDAPDVPPLGLAHLAAFIRKNTGEKYKVDIWDLNIDSINEEQFQDKLMKLDYKPCVIGVGGIVTVFSNMLWMLKECKKIFPETLLVAGGSVASTVPHLLFKHSPVDVCVKGEGEVTLLEIINKLADTGKKEGLIDIEGLFLWDNEKQKLINTPERLQNQNLDTFGMPAYDLLSMMRYAENGINNLRSRYRYDFPPGTFPSKSLHMSIVTSRGCTNKCTFCYRQFSKIGMNSPEFIKEHILWLNKEYGINIFTFIDELFNISAKRMDQMCRCLEGVKQEIPDFYFRIAGVRTDVINDAFLKKLKNAGCLQITYGLESGSARMLKSMNKRVTVEQNRDAVIATKNAGIFCVPQFVVGLPGEDKNTLKETLKFIKSIDFWSFLAIHNANAYPGSEIYHYAQNKGLIKDEFSHVSSLGDTENYPLALADISKEDVRSILGRFIMWRDIRLTFKRHPILIAFFIVMAGIMKKTNSKLRRLRHKNGK